LLLAHVRTGLNVQPPNVADRYGYLFREVRRGELQRRYGDLFIARLVGTPPVILSLLANANHN